MTMGLLSSIAKVQNLGLQFYAEAAQAFSANNLIRETWTCMSQDLRQQIAGLQALPHSFWNQLKSEEDTLRQAVQSCWTPLEADSEGQKTLGRFLSRSLDFEEPLILKVYVPLIRELRAGGSGHVLDLYIMVKAHVSRLLQVIQSFSGDPSAIQRAAALFQNFEKDVQVPREPIVYHSPKAMPAARPKKTKSHAKSRQARRALPEKRSMPKPRKALIKVSRRAQR